MILRGNLTMQSWKGLLLYHHLIYIQRIVTVTDVCFNSTLSGFRTTSSTSARLLPRRQRLTPPSTLPLCRGFHLDPALGFTHPFAFFAASTGSPGSGIVLRLTCCSGLPVALHFCGSWHLSLHHFVEFGFSSITWDENMFGIHTSGAVYGLMVPGAMIIST